MQKGGELVQLLLRGFEGDLGISCANGISSRASAGAFCLEPHCELSLHWRLHNCSREEEKNCHSKSPSEIYSAPVKAK